MTGSALCGGIATANLNILSALTDLARERRLGLSVLSYLEHDRDRPEMLPPWVAFHGFEGKRWRFTQHLLCTSLPSALIGFDHVTLALPVLPYATLRWVRTLIFTHGSEAWKRVRHSSRLSLRAATLCLANSDYTLKRMRAHLPPFRGAACPLGLSPSFTGTATAPVANAALRDGPLTFEAADGSTAILGPHCLLIAARMDTREGEKGHRELIRVFPALKRYVPDVQLVCAGPGDDGPALKQLARHHGVAASVLFPGYVPLATLQALYQHCYALVMPSQQEGFGLAYLEAMQYAKPCVGCFNQGAEDVIAHGETGLLVHDPADTPSLLGVLKALLEDHTYAQWLGQNGYKRLQREFTAHQYQARLKAHIAGLLD